MASLGRRRARRGIVGVTILCILVVAAYLLTTRSGWSPSSGTQADDATSTMISALPDTTGMVAPVAQAIPGARPTPARVPVGLPVRPIVAEGRTSLAEGLFVVRTGDTVEVHFDTPENRTRRRDKFERIVRETLPAVYGPVVEDALSDVPEGGLLASGELPAELTESGVRLRTAEGSTLIVWPSTRPGRDGPLVVTYRATIVP